ncbi:MAG: hypothetical protein ABIX01_11910 [Chitinophagaceae bacterium]
MKQHNKTSRFQAIFHPPTKIELTILWFEELLSISTSNLLRTGFFKLPAGTVFQATWRKQEVAPGEPLSSVAFSRMQEGGDTYMQVQYNWKGQIHTDRPLLRRFPNNSGRGLIWYFWDDHFHTRMHKVLFDADGKVISAGLPEHTALKKDKWRVFFNQRKPNNEIFKPAYHGPDSRLHVSLIEELSQTYFDREARQSFITTGRGRLPNKRWRPGNLN